jgi:hypothetical protein
LYAISSDFEYLCSATQQSIPPNTLDELHNRLQSTLSETNAAWSDQRAKELAAKNGVIKT